MFIKTIQRALTYRITSPQTIEQMAAQLFREDNYRMPSVTLDEDYKSREAYLEGCISDETDLEKYDRLLGEEDE